MFRFVTLSSLRLYRSAVVTACVALVAFLSFAIVPGSRVARVSRAGAQRLGSSAATYHECDAPEIAAAPIGALAKHGAASDSLSPPAAAVLGTTPTGVPNLHAVRTLDDWAVAVVARATRPASDRAPPRL